MTRPTVGILVSAALVGAVAATRLARRPRAAVPIAVGVTPPAGLVSARVGAPVVFSASTEPGAAVTWFLWTRPVSHAPSWSWVPAAADAGWQHVTLAVERGGARVERMWDVGVVGGLPPALFQVVPPAGPLAVAAGERPRFRCGARTAAARPGDRLRFDWTLDGRLLRHDDGPATTAYSELVLPAADAGVHRLAVRVEEGDGDRGVSGAEWRVDVAAARAAAPPPPAAPPPATVVRASGPRRLAGVVGERFAFAMDLAAAPPRTRWDWAVDGRRAQRGAASRYEWAATAPGRHRVSVAVSAGRKTIARDAWTIAIAER